MSLNNNNKGAEGAAKSVTSTVCPHTHSKPSHQIIDDFQFGTAVGGITRTAGNVVGAAGKGVGDTINNTTGTKQVGDGLQSLTNGVDDGANRLGKGAENAGEWKK